MASPATMPLGETIETPRGRGPLIWAGCFSFVLACHLGVGLSLLPRILPGAAAQEAPGEAILDLSLASLPSANLGADPLVEPAPEVGEPEIAAAEPIVEPEDIAAPIDPPEPVAIPPVAMLPKPAVTAPSPQVPRIRAEPDRAEAERAARQQAVRVQKARERADALRGRERGDAQRRQPAATSRPSPTGKLAALGTPAAATPGASAAASAAWRSQIVGILRGRFAGGASGGMAGVTFGVTRGGQVVGARLAASSGNPKLDAAALAAFRGSVPPPPPGYVGVLTFNIRLGVR